MNQEELRKEAAEKYAGEEYQSLFDHMSQEHGLTLLQSEMDEIRNICRDMDKGAEWQAERERWISVEDGLPPNRTYVLVYTTNAANTTSCEYKHGCWFNGLDRLTSITHWQPLPNIPKI